MAAAPGSADPSGAAVLVVPGAATRRDSVAAGLAAGLEALPGCEVVLVHDAARPLVPADLVVRVDRAVRSGHDAVIPVVPVTDTVKRVAAAPGAGSAVTHVVESTPDRDLLRAVQTPQGFRVGVLVDAHAAVRGDGSEATDDAGLVEALGLPVWCVPGDERAMKITTERDLRVAEMLLREGA
ncbi:hypothetical protein GCM10025865_19280 [Paraoerskovia sediminicola]|uniref:2-C-methyl-D-erythritol 4-phosphate cytidylyltransferase n=1 Tax=Paraoerskovia sediminicola TaxID=1138587 RepID=A0ABN6XCM4_9CELL|nr:2-C-methyl-D-erythritol 4-phosphate cytidylyltransferase [Paraoerskovia sediminicola]BDZ42629.1 hypothetical protein GCM10025865_19280 [Paraoerskovia sediminicola]